MYVEYAAGWCAAAVWSPLLLLQIENLLYKSASSSFWVICPEVNLGHKVQHGMRNTP